MSHHRFIAASLLSLTFAAGAGAQTLTLGSGPYPSLTPTVDPVVVNAFLIRHPAPLTVRGGHANFEHPAITARSAGTSTDNTQTPFLHAATQVTVRGGRANFDHPAITSRNERVDGPDSNTFIPGHPALPSAGTYSVTSLATPLAALPVTVR